MLARRINSSPNWRDIPIAELKPIVRKWHQAALPTIRTKAFDETWLDFVQAYGNVDPGRCVDSVMIAMHRAMESDFPPECRLYDTDTVQRLVALCSQLSRNTSDGVFYLSCRKASAVIGIEHTLAARMLKMLVLDGVLKVIEQGGPHSNRASRYRYVPIRTKN